MPEYLVIMPDGKSYGPADMATLTSWAREGRLTPSTLLEDPTSGQRVSAGQVHGLFGNYVGPPSSPGMDYYRQNPYGSGYGSPDTMSGMAIASLVLSVLAVPLVCLWPLSILCAALGAIFGAAGLKGNPPSRALSIAGLVVGLLVFVGWAVLFGFGFFAARRFGF